VTTAMLDRVAVQAQALQPLRIFLSVLSAPFYAAGWVLGMVWVVLAFAYAAVLVGVTDARVKAKRAG